MTDDMMDAAYHRSFIYTAGSSGCVTVVHETNDNLDRGYPNECARWESTYASLEDALKRCGGTRVGCSGVLVTVTVDGVVVDERGHPIANDD